MKTINTTPKSASTIRELSIIEIQNVSGGKIVINWGIKGHVGSWYFNWHN